MLNVQDGATVSRPSQLSILLREYGLFEGKLPLEGAHSCPPASYIERGGRVGSSTLSALSAPLTGKSRGSRSPTCTSIEAWSQ